MTEPAASTRKPARHGLVAGMIAGLVLGMGAMSYAAVPLYQMFCRATGYGGTTQVAEKGVDTRGTREMQVRFDANIASDLPWTLAPETPSITLLTGETRTVFFKVRNLSDKPTAGIAGYNVSPDQSGAYFTKISCFCFSEQKLGPGESAEWPVVFYLDPALEKDETMAHVESVTLSYTLYASKQRSDSALAERKF